MQTLYWQRRNRSVRVLEAAPFKSEQEFEAAVFATSELFADIFLLKRQVRGGGKPGIPDIVGIDSEGNVCITQTRLRVFGSKLRTAQRIGRLNGIA